MNSLYAFFSKMTLEKKTILLTLMPTLTILLNIKSILTGLAFIIFLDLLTGIRKSFHEKDTPFNILKKDFWKVVKSEGLRNTWRKTYEYGIGIIVFAVFEGMILKIEPIELMERSFSLTELAVVTASIIEVYSIYENMEAISGRNLFKKILQFLPKPIRSIVKNESKDTKIK